MILWRLRHDSLLEVWEACPKMTPPIIQSVCARGDLNDAFTSISIDVLVHDLYRWTFLDPGLHQLPRAGRLQNQRVSVTVADDLQSNRQPGFRPASRDAGGGLPREIERIREARPLQRPEPLAPERVGIVLTD